MRLVAVALLALGACATPAAPAPTGLPGSMRAYVEDPAVGRRALEQSVVRSDNGYSTLRLAKYDAAHWGALPEHNPPTAPIMASRGVLAAPPSDAPSWTTIDVDSPRYDLDDLRALGEQAFFRYPLQISEAMPAALAAEDHAGVWEHEGRLGAVWVSLPRGGVAAAFTCATCHASMSGDHLVAGRNNADVDVLRLHGAASVRGTWGGGRADVTEDGIDNPVAITDLRPVRYQRNLHHAATLRNDPVALAVRIETLMITSHREAVRPPRKIAAALAVYLLGLAPETPLPGGEGAAVFARACGGCHQGEAASGPPVLLATIGTDPAVGASPDRGTGFYRVPSLRAVGDRRRMFASGAIEDLDALMAPDRAVAGHRYGLDLDSGERAALLAYLRGL